MWLKDQPEDVDAVDVLAHIIDMDPAAEGELMGGKDAFFIAFSDGSVWEAKHPLPSE